MGNEIEILERQKDENNREYVYRILCHNIMTLRLLPGTPIKEHDIAQLLNVSRTPVHEVVLLLKKQLLVDVFPQSGSLVSMIDLNVAREGYFLRRRVEPYIVLQLAGNLDREYTEKLTWNLEEQRRAVDSRMSADIFFALDDKFHELIYYAAKKSNVWNAVRSCSSHFDRIRYLHAAFSANTLEKFLQDHIELFHILLLGNKCIAENIENFIETHLGYYEQNFEEMYSLYREYFTF